MNPRPILPGDTADAVMRRFFTGLHADSPVVDIERLSQSGAPVEVDGDALAIVKQVS